MNYEYVFKPIECIACKESHNVNSDYQIGQEFKCPRCCESHILQREDVKEIWFYITIGSIDELHRIKIDHEKQKGILERMVAPVSSNKVHRKELVIEKYEEIKRELENNPIWEGYSWEEYPSNEDIPTSE
jgi:predicted RNA-binding Zn-ribbon protein involved in translation (DUF1610 family)